MRGKINFNILESLRGLAALYVCIGHSRANLWIGGEKYLELHSNSGLGLYDYLILGLNMLTRLSTEFVVIFFVLSGFSIAHSLNKSLSPLPFYKRRAIRLYPPYLGALLWAMLVVWIIRLCFPQFSNGTFTTPSFNRIAASNQLLSWDVFLKNIFYMPQLDGILRPFWSLIMEVIFYLIAPFVFRRRNAYYMASVLLFIFAMYCKSSDVNLGFYVYNFCFYNIFFAVGAALYHHYNEAEQMFRRLQVKQIVLGIAVLFFAMVAISLLKFYYEAVTAFLAALMSILLIGLLLSRNYEINWLMSIGRYSYTLYITHFPSIFLYLCLYFLITGQQPPYIHNTLAFVPCVFFCLGIAYLHYIVFEKRTKQLLDQIREKENQLAKEKRKPAFWYGVVKKIPLKWKLAWERKSTQDDQG
jgi:peptidoglycan/LPS O-acetylase OafA/YrhL